MAHNSQEVPTRDEVVKLAATGILLTLSYAALSTYIIFSMPFAFAASSATDLTPLPATKAVIEPPSFVPAVMADNDDGLSFPSFCSRMARVDANRAKVDRRSCVRAAWRSELRAAGNMAKGTGRKRRRSDCRLWLCEGASLQQNSLEKVESNGLENAEDDDLGLTVGYPALALPCMRAGCSLGHVRAAP